MGSARGDKCCDRCASSWPFAVTVFKIAHGGGRAGQRDVKVRVRVIDLSPVLARGSRNTLSRLSKVCSVGEYSEQSHLYVRTMAVRAVRSQDSCEERQWGNPGEQIDGSF